MKRAKWDSNLNPHQIYGEAIFKSKTAFLSTITPRIENSGTLFFEIKKFDFHFQEDFVKKTCIKSHIQENYFCVALNRIPAF